MKVMNEVVLKEKTERREAGRKEGFVEKGFNKLSKVKEEKNE